MQNLYIKTVFRISSEHFLEEATDAVLLIYAKIVIVYRIWSIEKSAENNLRTDFCYDVKTDEIINQLDFLDVDERQPFVETLVDLSNADLALLNQI